MGRGRRDESRGTLRAGAASCVCGGDEPAGSGAAVWDVVKMSEVLGETYELIQDRLTAEDDFREFVFLYPLRFWAGGKPEFSDPPPPGASIASCRPRSAGRWSDSREGPDPDRARTDR
jgi:hypothetical protein